MSGFSVTHIQIAQFRSYQQAHLTVPPATPIVLCGSNGAGKTNVLEALSLLSPGRGLRGARPPDLLHKSSTDAGQHNCWEITAVVRTDTTIHEIRTGADADKARFVDIDGKTARQLDLAGVVRVIWLTPDMDRLWSGSSDVRRRFLDRMTLSLSPSHAKHVLTYEKALRERGRLLREQKIDARWYTAIEAHMAQSAVQIQRARLETLVHLERVQSAQQSEFPQAALALGQGVEIGETVFAQQHSEADWCAIWAHDRQSDRLVGRTRQGPHRTDLHVEHKDKGIPARYASSGEQKALLVALILANARALLEHMGQVPIVLLDEVAAHLDRTRRAALIQAIIALRAQTWITGTDRDLAQEFGNLGTAWSVHMGNKGSRIETNGNSNLTV